MRGPPRPPGAPEAGPPAPRATPPGPEIGGCPVFPAENDWNRDISADPVDPRSEALLRHMGAGASSLHADFGAAPRFGIPYVVVPASQPRVPITFTFASQSD